LRSATWLLLGYYAVGSAADRELSIYSNAVPPASATDVLRQFMLIAENRWYLRDDFYQSGTLRALFGQVESISSSHALCPWSGRADIYRFAWFFPPADATVVPDFYITAIKYNHSCETLAPSLRTTMGYLHMHV
jgi:hypothetical protein